MSGIIVANTLRAAWKQILYWGGGLGVLGFYIVFIASNGDIVQGYADLFESMPPALLQAFGASDIAMLSTPEGWIVAMFVSEAALFVSAFAVMAGLNLSANEEQSGIMQVVLALPISRAGYLIERWIGYALIGLGILLLCAVITLLGIAVFGAEADPGMIFASILNLYPGALLVLTVTGLLATVVRRRAAAAGLAAVFVIASFVIGVIGRSASGEIADLMERLSYFTYGQGEPIIHGSYDTAGTLAVLVAVAIGFALSVRMFQRRDIGL